MGSYFQTLPERLEVGVQDANADKGRARAGGGQGQEVDSSAPLPPAATPRPMIRDYTSDFVSPLNCRPIHVALPVSTRVRLGTSPASAMGARTTVATDISASSNRADQRPNCKDKDDLFLMFTYYTQFNLTVSNCMIL